jgi:hypothetical protein
VMRSRRKRIVRRKRRKRMKMKLDSITLRT